MVGIHPKKGGTWKEIFVFKSLRIVQIYNVMSHGRRFYRSLEYTTDVHYSLRDMQPSIKDRDYPWPRWERHGAGHPYAEYPDPTSVVIIRDKVHPANISGTDEQFIPSRLLYGIVPSALLDSYLFWQDKVCAATWPGFQCLLEVLLTRVFVYSVVTDRQPARLPARQDSKHYLRRVGSSAQGGLHAHARRMRSHHSHPANQEAGTIWPPPVWCGM